MDHANGSLNFTVFLALYLLHVLFFLIVSAICDFVGKLVAEEVLSIIDYLNVE